MKQSIMGILAACAVALGHPTASAEKISLPLTPGLTRADIYVTPAPGASAGTLILCPGHNGNGEDMIDDPEWSDFAKKLNLNLVGLSFASNDDTQDRGYFWAETGSGKVLLDGLKRAFGDKQLPLLIYGFSRGAQFTYSFSSWKPELVLAWCAYSATEFEPSQIQLPRAKGIIACGDEDEPNYSSSTFQFLKGRSMARPWTWVSIAHTGHERSPALEAFARAYFTSILLNPARSGLWLDVDTETPTAPAELEEHPTLAAWLPDENVAQIWKDLHQP